MKILNTLPIESQREILLNECQVKLVPFGITFEHGAITSSKTRKAEYIFVKALIAFILKNQGYNLSHIAKIFGVKSHATIINLLKYDAKKQGGYRKQYEIITKALGIKLTLNNIHIHNEQNEQTGAASGEADQEIHEGAEANQEEVQTQASENTEN